MEKIIIHGGSISVMLINDSLMMTKAVIIG